MVEIILDTQHGVPLFDGHMACTLKSRHTKPHLTTLKVRDTSNRFIDKPYRKLPTKT